MENATSIQCSKGLLWISARVKTDNLLRVKVHRAIGLRSSDNNDNVQESKVAVHLLSGQYSTTIFTVRSRSVQHRYRNNTCILKYNGVFYLNTFDKGSSNQRICFTVYVTTGDVTDSMVGCFSMSLATLMCNLDAIRDFEIVNGWYAILPRDQGQREHVLVLVESPRHLLHDITPKSCASRSISDINDADIALPVSDGSVCGGHIQDGQLETDVDAAFCCLLEKSCSTTDRSSFEYEHQSPEVSCFYNSNAIHNMTTQGYITPSSRYLYENLLDTPCRSECHLQLHQNYVRRMEGNTLGLRKLEYGNLNGDNDSGKRFAYGLTRDHPNQEIRVQDKSGLGLHKKSNGYSTCCSATGVLETIKNQVRKMKSTTTGHTAVYSQNFRNDIMAHKVKAGLATENSFSGSIADSNNTNSAQFESWCSEKIVSGFESYLVPEEHSDPQSEISPIFRHSDSWKNHCSVSATSTPVCHLDKTKLIALQRRQVCFFKSALGSELGIRLAERHIPSKQRIECKANWNMFETSADSIASNYPIRAKRLFINSSTPIVRGLKNDSLCWTPTNLRSQNIRAFLTKYHNPEFHKSISEYIGLEPIDFSEYIRQDALDNSVYLGSFEDVRGSYEHSQRSMSIERHDPAFIHSTLSIERNDHAFIHSMLSIERHDPAFIHSTPDNVLDTFSKHSYGSAPRGWHSEGSLVSIDSISSSNSAHSFSTDDSSSSGSSRSSSSSNISSSGLENCHKAVHIDTWRVIVAEVAEGSAAEGIGLMAGDGILYINDLDVRSLSKDHVVKILTNTIGDIKIETERKMCLVWIK